jgi:hypothetical protein
VYAASIENKRLTFEVYGVWRKNMVMNDCQTGSIWQHATGEALAGPLKGQRLEILPAWETTWGELNRQYPSASYALEPRRFTGVMPRPLLMRALRITHHASLDGLSPKDQRLDAHTIIIGVVLNGAAKAYPLQALQAAGLIQDTLGGQAITLRYNPAGDRVTIQAANGQAVPCERQWWLGWSEFHPRSAVHGLEQL